MEKSNHLHNLSAKEAIKEGKKLLMQSNTVSESDLKGNIENFIGMAQVPIGLAGPMLISGDYTDGPIYVPMATTEGALVASYSRGMKVCSLNGGVKVKVIADAIQRSPYFKFNRFEQAVEFCEWVRSVIKELEFAASQTSRFAKLEQVEPILEGNSVILNLSFYTGDAAGQNMVTIASDAICNYISEQSPVKPVKWYIESNYSGDKKATSRSFLSNRGCKVVADVEIDKELLYNVLHTTTEEMVAYYQAAKGAALKSGAFGIQGQFANGLAAIFIACGQDAACISEASIGMTRMEQCQNGNLYASVTLPALVVGTVGGGTSLPTQKVCLELMECYGKGKKYRLAEICAATLLCGELSVSAALAANQFTLAHQNLGRSK